MHLAAETRSFARAEVLMRRVLGHALSAKTLERLTQQVGAELALQLDNSATALHGQEVIVPEVAVASCDGGRIRTREPAHGPGVHEPAWRESKNASFEKMTAAAPQACDPCPQLPDTFRQVAHVAKIAETAAFDVTGEQRSTPQRPPYEGPRRVLRTCLSSLTNSQEFGQQMQREARRRRFHEAARRVFIGDGLAWNWSIWREHFPTFIPILDFIHAVQYLYAAAQAWEADDQARWTRYLELAEAVWQGRVVEVVERMRQTLRERGVIDEAKLCDDHPLRKLQDAARYLENNRSRMNYPRYRREGLPITSAPMESLIKQINYRVKGTEMFWNAPAGAEAILQLRAASLCDDDRLDQHLQSRPGHPHTRRSTPATAA